MALDSTMSYRSLDEDLSLSKNRSPRAGFDTVMGMVGCQSLTSAWFKIQIETDLR